jgi:hypothetical protein
VTTALTFATYESFKSSVPSQGAWWLERRTAGTEQRRTVAEGAILFNAHWRATLVEAHVSAIALSDLPPGSGYTWALIVSDQWGYQNRTVHLACTAPKF